MGKKILLILLFLYSNCFGVSRQDLDFSKLKNEKLLELVKRIGTDLESGVISQEELDKVLMIDASIEPITVVFISLLSAYIGAMSFAACLFVDCKSCSNIVNYGFGSKGEVLD